MAALRLLYSRGHEVAVDYRESSRDMQRLLEVAHIVAFDVDGCFRTSLKKGLADVRRLAQEARCVPGQALATAEDYRSCRKLPFDFF